jgi:hypothetical protein
MAASSTSRTPNVHAIHYMKLNKKALEVALSLILRVNVVAAGFSALIWIFKGRIFYLMLATFLIFNAVGLIFSVALLWKTRCNAPQSEPALDGSRGGPGGAV